MPRFIAVHPMTFSEEQLQELARRGDEIPEGVIWYGTWCGTDDAVAYCEWAAPDAATIKGVLDSMNVPVTAIQEVRSFEVKAGKFAE
jgi:hypothetical protein